ncbi:MAG TPA: response regulator [Steroidobacteraceae bacterium]|nr:response regulator [Steroidobacteraceae bacterium]
MRSRGRSGARILAIDDEPDALAILRIFLSAEGWQVATASSAVDALRLIRKRTPDLIVTDCAMPGMTGLELCRELRGHVATRHIPIILHTGMTTIPRGERRLYDRLLVKPADLDHLASEIRGLLGSKRTRSRKS